VEQAQRHPSAAVLFRLPVASPQAIAFLGLSGGRTQCAPTERYRTTPTGGDARPTNIFAWRKPRSTGVAHLALARCRLALFVAASLVQDFVVLAGASLSCHPAVGVPCAFGVVLGRVPMRSMGALRAPAYYLPPRKARTRGPLPLVCRMCLPLSSVGYPCAAWVHCVRPHTRTSGGRFLSPIHTPADRLTFRIMQPTKFFT